LEEKINYVNTHAKLSWSVSVECIGWAAAKADRDRSGPLLEPVVDRARFLYRQRIDAHQRNGEVRLESIVLFLMKNDAPVSTTFRNSLSSDLEILRAFQDVIVNLALLEQFSLAHLDSYSDFAGAIRTQGTNKLQVERQFHTAETRQLRNWHQAYHSFRVSAQCFVQGVEYLNQAKSEEALDMFFTSYTMSVKIVENPPAVGITHSVL
jgi:hypothetical protein